MFWFFYLLLIYSFIFWFWFAVERHLVPVSSFPKNPRLSWLFCSLDLYSFTFWFCFAFGRHLVPVFLILTIPWIPDYFAYYTFIHSFSDYALPGEDTWFQCFVVVFFAPTPIVLIILYVPKSKLYFLIQLCLGMTLGFFILNSNPSTNVQWIFIQAKTTPQSF